MRAGPATSIVLKSDLLMRRVFLLITLAVLCHVCQRAQALPVYSTTFVLPSPAGEVTTSKVFEYIQTYLNINFITESQVSLST